MSIYFIHFFEIFLPFSVFCAVFFGDIKSKNAKNLAFCIIIGGVFAYIATFIAHLNLANANLALFANIMLIFGTILAIVAHFLFKLRAILPVQCAIWTLLSFAFATRYLFKSIDFKIFSTSLLENTAIISLFLVVFAFGFCVLAFFLVRNLYVKMPKTTALCAILSAILMLNATLADIVLELIRKNLLQNSESLIDYVGKSVYYAFLNPYIMLVLLFILGIASLQKIPREIHKNALFDLDYRKKCATKNFILQKFILNICLCVVSFGILLYYDLYASKPITIDKPVVLDEPQNGVFEFSTEILSDNKLHRFAFINDEGKEIRFFLLNKFEDRSSPAVAFDACALCGDMGYIKKGGELICIACNVRIFLPSVGKFGGCNPIPLDFTNENGIIKITLNNVLSGANYFSKIISKEVIDPVNGAKLLNTEAIFRYEFNGRTYFFSSQESYEAFTKEPEKYAPHAQSALYLIQKYHSEI